MNITKDLKKGLEGIRNKLNYSQFSVRLKQMIWEMHRTFNQLELAHLLHFIFFLNNIWRSKMAVPPTGFHTS
jgi:hypothetical protein